MHCFRSALGSAILAAALAASVSAGDVLVVDASGGGSFTQIQPAVDAAVDGDTVLVKTGSYAVFTIDDKAVHVMADDGEFVEVSGVIRVENLSAGRDVILAGLRAAGVPGYPLVTRAALLATSNSGSLRIENCSFDGYHCGQGECDSGPAVVVRESRDVIFARCQLTGGQGGYAGHGLEVRESRVALYDTNVVGGSSSDGIGGQWCEAPHGGHAVRVVMNSFLYSSGSLLVGGDGGMGSGMGNMGCACGNSSGNGGAGLALSGSTAQILGCNLDGGAGAPAVPSCQDCCSLYGSCCGGCDGPTVLGTGVTWLPGSARFLASTNAAREGVQFSLGIVGHPGDEVHAFLTRETGFRFVPNFRGMQVTQRPGPSRYLGTIPATGLLTVPYSFPDLGPGVESRAYYLQAAHRDAQNRWTFGSPVCLVVLDEAF